MMEMWKTPVKMRCITEKTILAKSTEKIKRKRKTKKKNKKPSTFQLKKSYLAHTKIVNQLGDTPH